MVATMPDEEQEPEDPNEINDYSGNSHELMINEKLSHLENET